MFLRRFDLIVGVLAFESHVYSARLGILAAPLPDIQDVLISEEDRFLHAWRMNKKRKISDISFDLGQAQDFEESEVTDLLGDEGFAAGIEVRALSAFV